MKKNSRKKINIVVIFIYTMTLLLIFNFFYKETTNIIVGESASENIVSKETFENKEATELKKAQARNSVANIYKVLPNVSIETKNKVTKFGSSIIELKFARDMSIAEKLRYLKSNSPYALSDESFEFLLNSNTNVITNIISISNDLLSGTYNRGVKENDLSSELEILIASLKDLEQDTGASKVIEEILTNSLVPNEVLDEERTNELKSQVEGQVEPVIVEVGDIVLLKGETITEEKLELILKSGNQVSEDGRGILYKYGPYFFLIIVTTIYILYIYSMEEEVYLSSRLFILLFSNLIGIVIAIFLGKINIVLIPVLLVAIITNLYVDKNLVILNGIYFTTLIAFFQELNSIDLMYLNTIGILTVIFVNEENSRYSNFVIAIGSSIVSALLFNILNINGMEVATFWTNIILAVGGGITYMILAIGMSFIWENTFKILTPNRLQELSDSNQPLLRLLAEKAPGTYQHSLLVSNLAESAAKVIGANYQMTKAGALYHDVGKLMNPEYFNENQFGIENPHNQLVPLESAEIILNHMDNGRALAKKHNLPAEIISFIEEHHGDTMVNYFYYQAKLDDENVKEKDFQYRGRKPQNVETAIVMIADSCEAAVRSIKNKTEQNILEMINSVVDGKIKDRQFIENDISFSDIERIKGDLFKNLKSIYHERIEYPSEETE